ncbi:DUF1214 domain-containing protein [Candidatus Poriferisocius sp.]|uniref:DUF1214 domain-containing protein n=1 Tax=Candidatus Poriferisocius sp. TaxID=3101276 RepID=UPI003B5BCC85
MDKDQVQDQEQNLRASWNQLCDSLKGSVDYIFDPGLGIGPSEQAEGLRHHLRMLYWAIDRAVENNDPDRPELGWVYPSKIGQDNPDGLYMSAPVDLNRTYRLTGRIDALRYLGITLMDLRFGRGRIEQLLNVGTPDLIDVGDGRFDMIISPDANPGDHPGNWYQVPPRQCRLFVRQFFSDWTTENHAELYLDCLDPSGPPTRLDPVVTAARIEDLADEMSTVPKFWTDFALAQRNSGQINSFAHVPARQVDESGLGGSDQQSYGQCWYEVGDDQALLFEVTPPNCLYWNIQVGDTWYQSLDYVNQPTTLNDSQAHIDPDGVLRVVISHRDPGIQNWIALGGCPQGAITYRWNNAESVPVPTLRLMDCSDIDACLHPDTPRLSADDRAALNAERRRHALRRFTR